MTGVGRPIRFLALVLGLWIGARVAFLWPESASLGEAIRKALPIGPLLTGNAAAAEASAPIAAVPSATRGIARWPSTPSAMDRPPASILLTAASLASPHAAPGERSIQASPQPVAAPDMPSRALPPTRARRFDLIASSWLIVRGGSGGGAGAAGPAQLGGSQGGLRVLLPVAHGFALAARASAPLRGSGREAAVGVEWRPGGGPVSLLAERRFSLDGGEHGIALAAIAGIGPTRIGPGLELDAYGQAGVVLREQENWFADGAARVVHSAAAAGKVRLALGVGAWGGAQRGAERMDVGPTAVAAVPVRGQTIRVALDWRQRIAGEAAPGSGPALSIGADF